MRTIFARRMLLVVGILTLFGFPSIFAASYSAPPSSIHLNRMIDLGFFQNAAYSVFNPSNGYIYVSDDSQFGPSTVYIINGATNAVIAHPQIPCKPANNCATGAFFMVYSPSNHEVYVSDTGKNSISALKGTKVVASFSFGTPDRLIFDPSNNYVYVMSSLGGTVAVIDTSTNKLLATVNVGFEQSAINFDPTNQEVYVAYYNSTSNVGTVAAIKTTAVVARITMNKFGIAPDGLSFDPSNNRMYVCDNNNIFEISSATNKIVASVSATCGFLIYDPANTDMYLGSGSVVILSSSTNKVLATLPFGTDGMRYNPANKDMYIDVGNSTLFALNSATLKVVATVEFPGFTVPPATLLAPHAMAFDSTNKFMYVPLQENSSSDGVLAVISS